MFNEKRVTFDEKGNEARASEAPSLSGGHLEVGGVVVQVLESCHSLWVLDPQRMRFCRLPRGSRLDLPFPEEAWAPYYRLELEPSSGAFALALTKDGTRILRSWVHVEPCRHCDDQTGELVLGAIRPPGLD